MYCKLCSTRKIFATQWNSYSPHPLPLVSQNPHGKTRLPIGPPNAAYAVLLCCVAIASNIERMPDIQALTTTCLLFSPLRFHTSKLLNLILLLEVNIHSRLQVMPNRHRPTNRMSNKENHQSRSMASTRSNHDRKVSASRRCEVCYKIDKIRDQNPSAPRFCVDRKLLQVLVQEW